MPFRGQPSDPSVHVTGLHAAMTTWLDVQIGALLAELRRLGLDARTLVLFTSDNGPHA